MTLGSLFAGIGGFDLGFERAGFETVWQVEIDEYCRRVLERHFPRAERFEDIRECAEFPACDILAGGFPCQDISYAGEGAGLDGERSGLWREMLRAICLVRPRFTVVENVAALLRRGIGTVLGDLAESGNDAEWDCLPAYAFRAPHRRDRVFIIAYPECSRLAADLLEPSGETNQGVERQSEFWGQRWMHEPSGQYGRWMDAAPEARIAAEAWEYAPCEPLLLGIPDGVSKRVDRISALGNAVVPQIAQFIAERIKAVSL